jgi:predicted flap endonuclease-1-like 5' DNA nuclease
MTIIIGIALLVLGLAIGFILMSFFNLGTSISLFVGVLLVAAGAIVGFITEWLIDEAYRKNRELRKQMGTRTDVALGLPTRVGGNEEDPASETLADFLRKRDEELQQLRDQLAEADTRLDSLQDDFDAYQQTHPDDLTVVKGIGPVYQWKLRDAGFNTYKQLAEANPDQLRRMLDVKNWQRVNMESWIEQARDWAQRGT